jgi:hypothetical protein
LARARRFRPAATASNTSARFCCAAWYSATAVRLDAAWEGRLACICSILANWPHLRRGNSPTDARPGNSASLSPVPPPAPGRLKETIAAATGIPDSTGRGQSPKQGHRPARGAVSAETPRPRPRRLRLRGS